MLTREQYSSYEPGSIAVGTTESTTTLSGRHEGIILIADGACDVSLNDNTHYHSMKAGEQLKLPITVTKVFTKAAAATTLRYIALK